MKLNWLFYLGVGINIITILFTIYDLQMMTSSVQGMGGESIPMDSGMPTYEKLMSWAIPPCLIAWVGASFWLRSKGKILISNILVWIPALPTLAVIVFFGGLMLLFILFGK
jgi:hypothetical protein